MTTTFTPIKYATAGQIIYCSVISQSTGEFQAAPTIAAGDFQRSINGGAFANMDNIPVVTPAAGKVIAITLSVAETTCDRLTIIGSDAAGAEWDDVFICVPITPNPLEGVALADDAITSNKFDESTAYPIKSADSGTTILARMSEVIESSKTFKTMLLDLWAVITGNALANDATAPTSITYDSPDDTVQVTHTLTDTTRTVS